MIKDGENERNNKKKGSRRRQLTAGIAYIENLRQKEFGEQAVRWAVYRSKKRDWRSATSKWETTQKEIFSSVIETKRITPSTNFRYRVIQWRPVAGKRIWKLIDMRERKNVPTLVSNKGGGAKFLLTVSVFMNQSVWRNVPLSQNLKMEGGFLIKDERFLLHN